MKKTYVFLAEGFEEIEALTAVDILRRGSLDVKTVSINSELEVTGAHGVTVTADLLFSETDFADAVLLVLPGGLPGAENLYAFEPLRNLLERAAGKAEVHIGAICAAPAMVLGRMGLLNGESATSYPGTEMMLEGATVSDAPIVVSGRYITGNGPANAMRWALAMLGCVAGSAVADSVSTDLLFYRGCTDRPFDFG